jgi:membrane protease YdiL (CAAX protease family)
MLEEKPWKMDAVVRLFLLVLISWCLGGAAAGILNYFTSTLPKGQSNFWQIVIFAAFIQIPALVWVGLFLRQHNINWKDAFGWHKCEPATAAAYGILGALLFFPVAIGLETFSDFFMRLVSLKPEEQAAVQELQDPTLGVMQKAFFGVMTIVLAPVVEETLFRGILYPALKGMGRPHLALWLSSALFALAHVNMVTFLPLMAFALVLVYLYENFENLLAPVVAHAVFNAANFILLVYQDQINQLLNHFFPSR